MKFFNGLDAPLVGKFGSNLAIISQNLRVMYIQPTRENKLLAKTEKERGK